MPRLTRVERRALTRAEVLDVAEALFLEHGYAATSVDQIAEAAGYSRGAVYSNFSSKEDLFLALFDRRSARTFDVGAIRVLADPPAPGGAEALADALATMIREERDWTLLSGEFWYYAVRHAHLQPKIAEAHAHARRRARDFISNFIPMPTDQLVGDRIAALVVAAVDGLGFQWYADNSLDLERLLRDAMQAIVAVEGH